VVRPWRSERQERAYVQFEAVPGEQAQMDWVTGMASGCMDLR
jgi:hypothetical protein